MGETMIHYEQSTLVSAGSPQIFGSNQFFAANTLYRGKSKSRTFRLRVFASAIAASAGHGGFLIEPLPVPLATIEPEEHLHHKGLDFSHEHADFMIEPTRSTFVTTPNFFKNIYGHWLVDVLPGLLVAKNLLAGLPVKLLHSGAVPSFAVALGGAIGLTESDFVDVATLDGAGPQQLISASLLREHDFFHRPLLRQHFVSAVRRVSPVPRDAADGALVYVSRRNWQTITPNARALLNRDEVEACFRRAGYTILSPEQLSVSAQIDIFRQPRVIAGEAGSGLHNSIFMPPGGHVICLQSGRQNHVIQASLCDVFEQSSGYVVGEPETADWSANYSVNLADVNDAIAAVPKTDA